MTERRRVLVAVLPSGADVFVDGPGPVAAMVREANAKLDAERAEEARIARREGRRRRARERDRARKQHAKGEGYAEVGPRAQNVSEDARMTLALIPPSSARSRVASAVSLLQDALNELREAQLDESRAHAERADRLLADARAREVMRQAEAARRPHLALIDKRRVRVFADAVMRASRERSSVDQVHRLLVAFVEEVEKAGANG